MRDLDKQADLFFGTCDAEFGFLSDYQFGRPRHRRWSTLYAWTAQNNTTAIEVTLDRRDQQIDGELIRKVAGKVPERLGNVDCYYPLRLIACNSEAGEPEYKVDSNEWPLQPDTIRSIICGYSTIVKDLCKSALEGDFTGLPSRRDIAIPGTPSELI